MNERHSILHDKVFWVRLEHEAGAWLHENLRSGVWLDCLAPEHAGDTKDGVDVAGSVLLVEGKGSRSPYSFVVSVPQKMLSRHREDFSIEELFVDESQQSLKIRIAHEKKS